MFTKFFIITGFIVAFGAGLAVGTRSGHGPHTPPGPPPTSRPGGGPMGGWMSAELDLTPEQREQMKKIWEQPGPRGRGREMDDKRRELRRQRDDAIANLIRPEDKTAFDQINKTYADQTSALEAEMKSGFTKAVDQTKQILTPEQRVKYEAMLKRFEAERGQRDRNRGPRDHATSQPTSRPGDAAP